jgi:curved DNA-binding protein CbpA
MNSYIKILKPAQDTSPEELKNNYRALVKKNHPDLFPEEKRREQNYILMEINEAFLFLTGEKEIKVKAGAKGSSPEKRTSAIVKSANADYIYYKHGLNWFIKGHNIFNNSRYSVTNERNLFRVWNNKLIKNAYDALSSYRKSYEFFMKVINNYPESIWVNDCFERMNSIEKMNERYARIIGLLTDSE